MIAFKEEFIKRYLERLNHKAAQELKEKLPDEGFFAEMIEDADEIMRSLFKK